MLAGTSPRATYQSRMRPTNGEIRKAPASAQASAWVLLKIRVRLQSMPSRCSWRAASTPSQVAATLISTRSRPMPRAAYISMNLCAFFTVAAVSWAWSASTSMDTRPGTSPASAAPTAMVRRSTTSSTSACVSPDCVRAHASSVSMASAYTGRSRALRTRVGLVVQSTGRKRFTASKSPVSATTTESSRSCWSLLGEEAAVMFFSWEVMKILLTESQRLRLPLASGW